MFYKKTVLNNSETVKAVTLEFCNIQQHFIRDIRPKFGIPNSPQSADIGQNSDGGISNFRISGQSLIKENRHVSRTRRGGNSTSPPPISKRNPKKPTQIRVKACNFIKKSLSHSCFSVKFLIFSKLLFLNPSMTNAFPHLEISMRHFEGGWFKFCSINSGNKFCSEENNQTLSAIFKFHFY